MNDPFAEWLDDYEPARFSKALKLWFRRDGRKLPWRGAPDAYQVWVSEIMLQQTQVDTVRDFFIRFMNRFPNVRVLADAQIDEVLRIWEGLGYYRRARSLHAAAQIVVNELEGKIPDDFDSLAKLPGIGRYTASAILSIAHQQQYAILEGNTLRVYSRLAGSKLDIASPETQKRLWAFAEAILPARKPGDFNQALMDLGSMVCKPRNPECGNCRVSRFCKSMKSGTQALVPFKSTRTKFESIHHAAIVIVERDRVLMRQCKDDEWWTGLWDFPRITVPQELDGGGVAQRSKLDSFLSGWIHDQTGLKPELEDTGWQLKHTVTRYRIRLSCFKGHQWLGRLHKLGPWTWIALKDIRSLPLSASARRLAVKVEEVRI